MVSRTAIFKTWVAGWVGRLLGRSSTGGDVQASERIMLPGGSVGKQSVERPLPQCQRPGFSPWIRKIPWRRKWQPTPVFLPEEFHGQRSLSFLNQSAPGSGVLGSTPQGSWVSRADRRSFCPCICFARSGVRSQAHFFSLGSDEGDLFVGVCESTKRNGV